MEPVFTVVVEDDLICIYRDGNLESCHRRASTAAEELRDLLEAQYGAGFLDEDED